MQRNRIIYILFQGKKKVHEYRTQVDGGREGKGREGKGGGGRGRGQGDQRATASFLPVVVSCEPRVCCHIYSTILQMSECIAFITS